MGKKIVWISDFDLTGSGYLNLSTPLCSGLTELGHEVKAIGLGYKGEEHDYPFSILPAKNFQEIVGIAQNLFNMWKFDICVAALDVPMHERILGMMMEKPFGYIGIMPIEADPLCFSWAMVLMKMEKALVISQFGTDEAIKMGVDAEHIRIGLDTEEWKYRTIEDKMDRGVFGFDNETFVVLTVADNQERKNLSRGMEIFAEFSMDKPNTKYILVTREHNPVGWKLRDYAQELGMTDKLMLFERGISQEQLWSIFAVSDVFLLPSKAEGLGMCLLETMAVGVPVIATNCTGMKEVITEGGGFPLDYDECCTYRDPFGNGNRRMANVEHGVTLLNDIYGFIKNKNSYLDKVTIGAREYIETRDWDTPTNHLDSVIKELLGDESEE